MDFMKVLDQTVREIKREVNIKVLKVPEIEQKVLDATSNEPWGPHGSDLTEIANCTKKFTECQLIMSTLWTRLGDGGRNWRHVYKALAVIEYLIAHGSERALDDIIEHTFQISSLASFEYVEPNGKDTGINVRKKAETMTNLLSNKDKIQEARNKAAANRDKYFGLSSTGITYKSSTASTGFGSSSFQPGERYGGLNARKEGEMFKDSYSNRDRFGSDELNKDSRAKSHREYGTGKDGSKVRKSSHSRSASQDAPLSSTSRASSKLDHSDDNYGTVPSQTSGAAGSLEDDDFDDFDPRGTSNSGAATANVKEVNLFGDFMDAPEMSTTNGNAASEVDLFADADFVSASPNIEASVNFQPQADVDLFASQPTTFTSAPSSGVDLFAASNPPVPSASSSGVDLFAAQSSPVQSETVSPKIETSSHAVDPFASVPLNNFDGSDLFGAFSSHTDQVPAEPIHSSVSEGNLNSLSQKPSVEKKKDSFQVKSGIWSDSLTRGLIDLNISAPKKVNLTDIGIVGGLTDGSDDKEKGPPTTTYMGRAMGSGSGLGRSMSGFTPTSTGDGGGVGTGIDDDFFSSLGNYKK